MRHFIQACLIALLLSAALATKAEPPATAEALGLMRGSPPGDDQLVTVENAFLPPLCAIRAQLRDEILLERARAHQEARRCDEENAGGRGH